MHITTKYVMSFIFKKFLIDDTRCGMKVGTDGVVLGAWTSCTRGAHVVDVGAGSGLIAIMMAQRGAGTVEALEIDRAACEDCRSNVNSSPWRDRINVSECSFLNYNSPENIDLIVSNPPFFADGEHAQDVERALARHEGDLNYSTLIDFATVALNTSGRLAFIYPYGREDEIIFKAEMSRLKLRRICHLRQNKSRPWIRTLFEFCRIDGPIDRSELTIRNSGNKSYTAEFAYLCRDFYLEL